MTSGDVFPEIVEALNETANAYGVTMDVGDRVTIARRLGRLPVGALSVATVADACAKQGFRRLPRGFGSAVVARVRALGKTRTLVDVLVEYRQFAVDALSAEFGAGKSKAHEESLCTNLRTYLTTHAEVEARTGRGKTDIYLVELDTVIEVKVWTNQSTFDAGVEELGRYIHTRRPKDAVIVVFGDRDRLPAIAQSHMDPFGTPLQLEGLSVPVVVVPFEGVAPSKALREKKARTRNGRRSD
jgi:hypothetical protein